jgi:hypothetical protein
MEEPGSPACMFTFVRGPFTRRCVQFRIYSHRVDSCRIISCRLPLALRLDVAVVLEGLRQALAASVCYASVHHGGMLLADIDKVDRGDFQCEGLQ